MRSRHPAGNDTSPIFEDNSEFQTGSCDFSMMQDAVTGVVQRAPKTEYSYQENTGDSVTVTTVTNPVSWSWGQPLSFQDQGYFDAQGYWQPGTPWTGQTSYEYVGGAAMTGFFYERPAGTETVTVYPSLAPGWENNEVNTVQSTTLDQGTKKKQDLGRDEIVKLINQQQEEFRKNLEINLLEQLDKKVTEAITDLTPLLADTLKNSVINSLFTMYNTSFNQRSMNAREAGETMKQIQDEVTSIVEDKKKDPLEVESEASEYVEEDSLSPKYALFALSPYSFDRPSPSEIFTVPQYRGEDRNESMMYPQAKNDGKKILQWKNKEEKDGEEEVKKGGEEAEVGEKEEQEAEASYEEEKEKGEEEEEKEEEEEEEKGEEEAEVGEKKEEAEASYEEEEEKDKEEEEKDEEEDEEEEEEEEGRESEEEEDEDENKDGGEEVDDEEEESVEDEEEEGGEDEKEEDEEEVEVEERVLVESEKRDGS